MYWEKIVSIGWEDYPVNNVLSKSYTKALISKGFDISDNKSNDSILYYYKLGRKLIHEDCYHTNIVNNLKV